MKSIRRWIAVHPKPSKIILVIAITVIGFFALDPNVYSFGIRFFIMFSMLYSAILFVNTTPFKLMRKPTEILEQQCDPYPFLEELEHMVNSLPNNAQGQFFQVHYGIALAFTGQLEKGLEVMQNIPIEQFKGSAHTKLLYYCNLSDMMFRLNRFEEADALYEKTLEIYRQLPDSRGKKAWEHTLELSAIEALYRSGDYALALRKLSRIPCHTKRYVIGGTMLAARCNIALEEFDKAKEKLQYVIDNGNTLYFVNDAKSLLETLS